MNDIAAGSVLRRRTDVRFRRIDDEGVVVRQSAAEVLVFNDVAVRILGMADGTTAVAGWIDALLEEYDVERPALERDVLAFAAELVEQGLLEPAAGSPEPAVAAVPALGAAAASAAAHGASSASGAPAAPEATPPPAASAAHPPGGAGSSQAAARDAGPRISRHGGTR
jgi:hypothetical protein